MHGHDTTFTQEARPILIRILVKHSVIQIERDKVLELNRRTKNGIDPGVFSRRWVVAVVHGQGIFRSTADGELRRSDKILPRKSFCAPIEPKTSCAESLDVKVAQEVGVTPPIGLRPSEFSIINADDPVEFSVQKKLGVSDKELNRRR